MTIQEFIKKGNWTEIDSLSSSMRKIVKDLAVEFAKQKVNEFKTKDKVLVKIEQRGFYEGIEYTDFKVLIKDSFSVELVKIINKNICILNNDALIIKASAEVLKNGYWEGNFLSG